MRRLFNHRNIADGRCIKTIKNLVNSVIKHLSTGAGFLPPTVPPHLFSSSIFPTTKKRGLRESGGTRVGRSFVVIAWNFQGRKKVEIVCFFCGGLWGGVRLIGAFSRNILELLLLSDF